MKKQSLGTPDPVLNGVEIVEQAALNIDTLLRSSSQTIGLANLVKNEFDIIKTKLAYLQGGTRSVQPPGLQQENYFPPMNSFMGEKIKQQEDTERVDISPSEFDKYKNPEQGNYKKRVYSEMYIGRLRNLLIRKMRPGVESLLKESHSEEYAAENYPGICELIIKIHLFSTRDGFKNLAISVETVNKYNLDYPCEFNFLKDVNAWIEDGKTLEEIEKKLFK